MVEQTQIPDDTGVDATLVSEPVLEKPIQRGRTLDELLAGITDENLHAEIDFGPPTGKELL